MPGKLSLHPSQRASRFLLVREGESLEIGRDPDCGLVVEDARVSKRHACLRWTGSGWSLDDLGSKNGTAINGEPATGQVLADGDWISLGGLLGRFERVSAEEAAGLESERLARLQTSVELRRRLGAELEPVDLLLRFLESAMQVTGAERGFVLVAGPDGSLRAEVAAGFEPEALHEDRFRGSLGAVRQAVEARRPVVVNDVRADPRLGVRPSVVAQGLGAIACVPLLHDERLLGLIYVDGRRAAPGFTDLDLEILESLADHTAVVLAGSLLDQRVRRLLRPSQGVVSDLQQRLQQLLPVR